MYTTAMKQSLIYSSFRRRSGINVTTVSMPSPTERASVKSDIEAH